MDLRSIANEVSNTINENIPVSVIASTGYAIAANYNQVPTYADPVNGFAQVQELSTSDLRQIENLNLQGILRTIFLRGKLAGVVRAQSKGGDLVKFNGQTWLVVHVLEQWPTWVRAVICLQDDPS
jgi:hypothetical protein